jgi:nitrite reductase/ring-hydroxylating ferredoxin subunit
VFVEGTKVAVFRQGGRLFAVGDRCPHMGAALSEGQLGKGVIRCHWHGWQFDLDTGACRQKPWARLPRYEVREDGEDLLLRPLADEAAASGDDEEDLDQFLAWKPPARNGD